VGFGLRLIIGLLFGQRSWNFLNFSYFIRVLINFGHLEETIILGTLVSKFGKGLLRVKNQEGGLIFLNWGTGFSAEPIFGGIGRQVGALRTTELHLVTGFLGNWVGHLVCNIFLRHLDFTK